MPTSRQHIIGKFEYDDIKVDTFLTLPDNLDAAAPLYTISGHSDDSLYMKTSTGWQKVGGSSNVFAEGLTDDGSGNISWGGTVSVPVAIDGNVIIAFGSGVPLAGFNVLADSLTILANTNLSIGSGPNTISISPTQMLIGNDLHLNGQFYNPVGDTSSGNVLMVVDPTSGLTEWHPFFQFKASTTLQAAMNVPPGTQPTSPSWGDIYTDSGDGHLYYFNGPNSIWVQLDN